MQWRRLGAESCVGYMLLVIERPGYKTQLICPICPYGRPEYRPAPSLDFRGENAEHLKKEQQGWLGTCFLQKVCVCVYLKMGGLPAQKYV